MRWSAVSDARSEHRVAPTVVVAGSIALVAAYPLALLLLGFFEPRERQTLLRRAA